MPPLRTADRYYAQSAALARRAARRAWSAASVGAAVLTIQQHQAAQAIEASAAATAMLAEQGITERPTATINALAFTSSTDMLTGMLAAVDTDTRWQFDRLVEALVHDAGRTAQSVDTTSRQHVQHVRHLSPPSCSRCAVLAGRVYRYSEGFQRHPGCDCTMVPVTAASPDLTYDPEQMARDGLVTGLSKADMRALDDGADFNQLVNARLRRGGIRDSGEVLRRGNRPTPAGIYRQAGTRAEAVDLLRRYQYLR